MHGAQLLLEHERVVCPGLDVNQQAVEGCDVDAGRIEPALERLHERRSRAGEGIEDMLTGPEVAGQQHLDELRDELAQVWMQPMHMPRALTLGEIPLRPGEGKVDVGVEGVLSRGHPRQFDVELRKPRPGAPACRSEGR